MDVSGIYVPLITPFGEDGEVAYDDLATLAEHYIGAGVAGLLALGTTGEPATLTSDERTKVIQTIAGVCKAADKPLIVGAGTNSTQAVVEAVTQLDKVPQLSAVMSVVPYYTRPSEAGIVEHFGVVAQHSPVPLVIYNIPYRTGRGLGSASLLQLANTPNIVGLKQAVGGVDADTLTLMADKPSDFDVMCGDDPFIYSLMCLGGSGAIAASAHVCTEQFVQMVAAHQKGDVAESLRISNQLVGVCQTLFTEPSPAVIKGVLHAQGLISSPQLRLPMTKGSREAVESAVGIIEKAAKALD